MILRLVPRHVDIIIHEQLLERTAVKVFMYKLGSMSFLCPRETAGATRLFNDRALLPLCCRPLGVDTRRTSAGFSARQTFARRTAGVAARFTARITADRLTASVGLTNVRRPTGVTARVTVSLHRCI